MGESTARSRRALTLPAASPGSSGSLSPASKTVRATEGKFNARVSASGCPAKRSLKLVTLMVGGRGYFASTPVKDATMCVGSSSGSLEGFPPKRKIQSVRSWLLSICRGSLLAGVEAKLVTRSRDVTAGQTVLRDTLARGLFTEESGLSSIPNQSITYTAVQFMDCIPCRKSIKK